MRYLDDKGVTMKGSLIHIVLDITNFGWIVYNWAIVYNCQNSLEVVVHMIIIDQCNQTVC